MFDKWLLAALCFLLRKEHEELHHRWLAASPFHRSGGSVGFEAARISHERHGFIRWLHQRPSGRAFRHIPRHQPEWGYRLALEWLSY